MVILCTVTHQSFLLLQIPTQDPLTCVPSHPVYNSLLTFGHRYSFLSFYKVNILRFGVWLRSHGICHCTPAVILLVSWSLLQSMLSSMTVCHSFPWPTNILPRMYNCWIRLHRSFSALCAIMNQERNTYNQTIRKSVKLRPNSIPNKWSTVVSTRSTLPNIAWMGTSSETAMCLLFQPLCFCSSVVMWVLHWRS